ncbi:hypothetical protein HJB82_10320 [Rhizobium sp. NZLR10]|uniref:hypothetical protein n=1 Tax=Rhizobium sp. NZLR10 TaxID=2731097 RepID=UPI001C840548|nr:hypothetical protein [Rhizobium sp. NZLR10]MBX5195718.1 hypothetical protein [Rhizobium sp. NZLR10]
MTENVVSFDESLQRLKSIPFGVTVDELRITSIGTKIVLAKSELQTVQAYIDVVYAGRITVMTDDGGELPGDTLAHSQAKPVRGLMIRTFSVDKISCELNISATVLVLHRKQPDL